MGTGTTSKFSLVAGRSTQRIGIIFTKSSIYGNMESRTLPSNRNAITWTTLSIAVPKLMLKLGLEITGWIGTARRSGDLKERNESINKLVIFVREKLAQEDMLEEFGEGGVYASYVFGELHADFLDIDVEDDIATSSRQKIIEDDPRYIALRKFVGGELKEIQSKWTDLRRRKGEEIARQIPAIDSWFQQLGQDHQRKARAIFGKINQLNLEDDQRKVLLQNSVIAFETLRHKEQLDKLDSLTAKDISRIGKIFYDLDDLEATLYHRIVNERLRVIQALKNAVDNNAP